MSELNVAEIRKDFPFFDQNPLAYLDNSATTQKPRQVIEAVSDYYYHHNANPFRGLYELSVDATECYEEARKKTAEFLHAADPSEIIFTRNASESLNLAARSLSEMLLKPGDEVVVTVAEHHSNMLPWRIEAERYGATVKYLDVDETGEFSLEEFRKLLTPRTKIVAITAMSNIFGRLTDLKSFAATAHEKGAVFVADGAQSVPHSHTDVQESDVDFLAFSGHKMLAPMGIGVLYGKKALLEKMPVFLSGGEMIDSVSLEKIDYAPVPHKFEAGTVNAGGAVGLAAAIDYLEDLGLDNIEERETMLTEEALDGLRKIPHVHVLGGDRACDHHGILTFTIEGVHPHDIADIIAHDGIAVRAGHHCAEPLHQKLCIPSTTRASLLFYNTEEEVERLVRSVASVRRLMGFGE